MICSTKEQRALAATKAKLKEHAAQPQASCKLDSSLGGKITIAQTSKGRQLGGTSPWPITHIPCLFLEPINPLSRRRQNTNGKLIVQAPSQVRRRVRYKDFHALLPKQNMRAETKRTLEKCSIQNLNYVANFWGCTTSIQPTTKH